MSDLAKIFENAVQNAVKNKEEPEALRIYCDCDGTLWDRNRKFNVPLFLWLYERQQEGFEVIIFSREFNEGYIRIHSGFHFGDPDVFENNGKLVTPKSEVAGRKAFLVIDDDHKSHSVDAKHRWNPNDPAVVAYINQSLKRPVRPMPPGML